MSIKEIEKVLEEAFPAQGFNEYQNKEWLVYLGKLATQISKIPCQKCKDIKYLDRDEVHSLIWDFLGFINAQDMVNADDGTVGEQVDTEYTKDYDEMISDILELAIPECKKCKELESKLRTETHLSDDLNDCVNQLKTELDMAKMTIENLTNEPYEYSITDTAERTHDKNTDQKS